MASPVSQPLPPSVEGTVPNPGPSGSGLSPILTADEKMAYVLEKLERIQTQNAWLREKYDKLKMEAVGPSRAKEAHISLPDKFDGTRSLYRGFIGQVKNVICIQSSRYATGRDRVGLIGSLLTKAAQSWFTPLVEKNSPVLDNYEEFLRQFEAILGSMTEVGWLPRKSATCVRPTDRLLLMQPIFNRSRASWTGVMGPLLTNSVVDLVGR